MRIIKFVVYALFLILASAHANGPDGLKPCLSSLQAEHLNKASQIIEELHRLGHLPLKNEYSVEEFLDAFTRLNEEQRAIVKTQILSNLKTANKSVNFTTGTPNYPEQRALGLVLGMIHNPVDLWNKTGKPQADQLLSTFLEERSSHFSKEQVLQVAQILRSQITQPGEVAYIYGSFPNGLAKVGNSDIDVAWENTENTDAKAAKLDSALKSSDSNLSSLRFSSSSYDPDAIRVTARISRVMIEVRQSQSYLLIYPAELTKDGMGNFTATEPIRLPLNLN